MSLEKLLKKIEDDGKEEINTLEKEYSSLFQKIEKEGSEKMKEIKKIKETEIEKEKERLKEEYEKEKNFLLKMELLNTKKEVLLLSTEYCKKEIKNISESEKKELFSKEIKEVKDFLDENSLVFVALSKKKELTGLFPGVPEKNIIEKKSVMEDEFIVEGKRFVLRVSLSEIIEKIIEKEEGLLSEILFKG
jgi:vacuolar-type H+-ATPase subunit E/Vma4